MWKDGRSAETMRKGAGERLLVGHGGGKESERKTEDEI